MKLVVQMLGVLKTYINACADRGRALRNITDRCLPILVPQALRHSKHILKVLKSLC